MASDIDLARLTPELRKKLNPVLPGLAKLRSLDCQRVSIYEAAVAYADLVAADQMLVVARDHLALIQRLYDSDRQRFAGGDAMVPSYEMQSVEAELYRSRFEVETKTRDVLIAEARLRPHTDQSDPGDLAQLVPTDRFDVPSAERLPDLSALLAIAISSRPDYKFQLTVAEITGIPEKDALLKAS